MRGFKNCKKAFTLLELSIVIALVAIISVATVSLCTLVNNVTKANSKKLDFMQDVTLLESLISSWADNLENQNSISNIDTPNHTLVESKVFYNNETKIFNIDNATYTFETIDGISFEVEKNETDFLIICSLALNGNYAADGSNTFVFTVNPFIGEGV